jgi:hypothetical protein
MESAKYVTLKRCAELYGMTEEAIRQLIKKGQWRQRIHWEKAPNGRIFIKLAGVNAWIEGKEA